MLKFSRLHSSTLLAAQFLTNDADAILKLKKVGASNDGILSSTSSDADADSASTDDYIDYEANAKAKLQEYAEKLGLSAEQLREKAAQLASQYYNSLPPRNIEGEFQNKEYEKRTDLLQIATKAKELELTPYSLSKNMDKLGIDYLLVKDADEFLQKLFETIGTNHLWPLFLTVVLARVVDFWYLSEKCYDWSKCTNEGNHLETEGMSMLVRHYDHALDPVSLWQRNHASVALEQSPLTRLRLFLNYLRYGPLIKEWKTLEMGH